MQNEPKLLQVGDIIYEMPSHLSPNEPMIKYTVERVTATKAVAKSNTLSIELKREYIKDHWIDTYSKQSRTLGSRCKYRAATPELDNRYEREALERLVLAQINLTKIKAIHSEKLKAIVELLKNETK